jgi:hypothetical protein
LVIAALIVLFEKYLAWFYKIDSLQIYLKVCIK